MTSRRITTLAAVLLVIAIGVSHAELRDAVRGRDLQSWLASVLWGFVVTIGGIPLVGALLRRAGCGGSDNDTSRWMGASERAAIYVLLLLAAPKAIAAFIAFKTAIRWPRLDVTTDEGHEDDKFAEAFFLAMIFNVAIAGVGDWIAGADLGSLP